MTDEGLGGDEELAQPPRRELPGSTRQRRALGALVVGLAVAAGIVIFGAPTADRHPTAAPLTTHPWLVASPSPSRTPSPTGLVIHVNDRNGSIRDDVEITLPIVAVPPKCLASDVKRSACATTRSVPAGLLAAIRTRFPSVRAISGTTVTREHIDPLVKIGLWSRDYSADLGQGTLLVVVSRRGAASLQFPISVAYADNTIVYSRREIRGLTVDVQLTVTGTRAPSAQTVDALAHDARLVTL